MISHRLTPRLCQLKHCFIELPSQIRQFNLENIALVEWETGKVYLWTNTKHLPSNICRIDKTFSLFLGLPSQSDIFISFPALTLPICVKVYLIPVSKDDWELLIPESDRISQSLLEQQRIVSKSILVPFWMHTNVCINLRIIDIEPVSEFVILQHKTDVCIFQDVLHYCKYVLPFDSGEFPSGKNVIPELCEPYDYFLPSQLFSDVLVSIEFLRLFGSYFEVLFNKIRSSCTTDDRMLSSLSNFHFRKHSEVFVSPSNFTTDGYSLYINRNESVFPLDHFQASLNSTCSPVILLASLLTRPSDLRSPYYDNLVFNPVVISSSNCASSYDFIYSFPNIRMQECVGLLVRPNLGNSLDIVKITLNVSQIVYDTYGELEIIEAFKNFVSSISKGLHFPVKHNQVFSFPIEGKSILVIMKFDCAASDTCFILSTNIFTDISISVTLLYDEELDILHFPIQTPVSSNSSFYGYQKLKIQSRSLICAFFSSLNTYSSLLTILVTADTVTPKVGRKSFLLYLVSIIQSFHCQICVNTLDCVSLIGNEFEKIKMSITNLFSCEKDNVVILTNIDMLFKDTVSRHSDGNLSSQIHNYLFSLLFKSKALSRKLIFIATSKTIEYQRGNSSYNKAKHLFHYKLVITRPTHQDKYEILQNYANVVLKGKVSDINCHLLISEFPNVAHGKYMDIITQSIQTSVLNGITENIQFLLRAQFSQHASVDNLGSSNQNKLYEKVSPTKKVFGMDGVRIPIFHILNLQLEYPRLLSKLPLLNKVGILLYGMPGTGKTFLVESLCLEGNFNIIKVRGPEILDKYIGGSEWKIRHIFATARASTPCVVFFDELDSIAQTRGSHHSGVLDRVVNQLLTELDGVQELEGVFIIATTSHPELIDPALLRPGRIGMHVKCTLPSQKERLNMLKSLFEEANITFLSTGEIVSLSKVTLGFSGADIKSLISTCKHAESRCKSNIDPTTQYKNILDRIWYLTIPKPSLSLTERERYTSLYTSFEDSKSCRKSKGIKVLSI